MYLSSMAYIDGYYYKPRINKKILREHSEGLICTSACLAGEVNFHLNYQSERNQKRGAKGYKRAVEVANEYRDIFGEDFYLEIMRHGIDHQESIDFDLIRLSRETGIKLVATNDTHYTKEEHSEAHEVLMCVGTGKTWNDEKRLRHTVHEFYIKSAEEMERLYFDIPEAIQSTVEIADKCNLELKLGDPTPPKFKFTKDYAKLDGVENWEEIEDPDYFALKCREGLDERLKLLSEEKHDEYRKRLEHEIDIINSMKFPGYMLIVWDFVRESFETEIPIGPGRGCLTREAKVYTLDNSYRVEVKNIDEVAVGDKVISHNNIAKEVTKTFEYDIEEELYKIETFYGDNLSPITLTGDHKVYLGENSWKEAKDISTKDWLHLPILKYKPIEINDFDLALFNEGEIDYKTVEDRIHYRFSQNQKNSYSLKDVANRTGKTKTTVKKFFRYLSGEDLEIKDKTIQKLSTEILKEFSSLEEWRDYVDKLNLRTPKRMLQNDYYFRKFLGRWIGDGYIRKDLSRKEVSIVFYKEDRIGVDETVRFAEINDYDYSILKSGSTISVNIQDRFLHSFIRRVFTDYSFESNSKYIPTLVFMMPKSDILDVLDGYISADGHKSSDRVRVTTVSKRLATELKTLLLQVAIPSTLREDNREYSSIQLKEGNSSYTVTFPAIDGSIYRVPKQRKGSYQIFDDHIRLKVIKVKKLPKKATSVYDFTVEDDHSYTTTNYTVHNSAAGSLVAYSLGITDIDPMKYDLLFERFLNPERVSMPDIDMDFSQEKRQQILKYVQKKYGRENVAQVITFNSMLAKGVIRDVARVYDVPYKESNDFAKLIPDELGITLEKAFEKEPKISEKIEDSDTLRKVWEISVQLEGVKRNSGVHAAGVVISNEPLWEKTPIYVSNKDENRSFVTQYSLNYLEDVDLIKFDFLGLKTLDVIDGAIKLIKHHKGVDINWAEIDMDDKGVYETVSRGDTIGLFQIESHGMQELNRRLKPTNFEDIIAVLALYRPGPMDAGMLDDFISRKHKLSDIFYPFEGLEFPDQLREILDPTYGIIVYQEQVMQIVQKIGGFSLGKSDIVRRAMGKKKIELMKEYKSQFADGAEEQGLDRKIAEDLFDLIEKFAGYGFNKSHSAAYAMITFQTAYLKTYYPAEFMASLLSTERDNMNKIALYVNEAKKMGIEIKAPDINSSLEKFSVVKKGKKENILFGLSAIRGVGGTAVDSILEARKSGKFTTLEDFVTRVNGNKVNKKVLESLVKAGAFSSLGTKEGLSYNRKTLLSGVDKIIEFSQNSSKVQGLLEDSLFGGDDDFQKIEQTISLVPEAEYSMKEVLQQEKDVLNFYISGHPMDEYQDSIDVFEDKITYIKSIDSLKGEQTFMLVGIVEVIAEKFGKKSGKKYGEMKLLDRTGEYNFTLFNKYEEYTELEDSVREEPFVVILNFKEEGDERSFFTRDIVPLSEVDDEVLGRIRKRRKQREGDSVTVQQEVEIPPIIIDIKLPIEMDRLLKIKDFAGIKKNRGQHQLKLRVVENGVEIETIDTDYRVMSSFRNDLMESLSR
jgi:DNA polymerase-3 subunit alpha